MLKRMFDSGSGRLLALVVFASTLLAQDVQLAAAQDCRWDGTAPFCSGECGGNETEVTRLGAIPAFWVPPFVNQNPPFGSNCVTGTKALCCSTPGRSCRWDGTAPFCDGECRAGETQEDPPPGSSSGAGCWTGSKVYCCSRSAVGTVSLPVAVNNLGITYAVTRSGDLLWYRHDGRNDGTFRWAFNEGKKVGNGWSFKHVFSGGDGVIYAINDQGDLLWYRHDGRNDGTFRWAFNEGRKVGNGWNVKHVFSGGNGVIYAINDQDDLLWYRHDGRNDGTFRWAFNEGRKVGNGWSVKHVFYGGDGFIYAIGNNDDLLWYRHDGRVDGTFRWGFNEGKKVGNGWSVKQVFYGAATEH